MKRYIEIIINGVKYRLLIDNKLEQELKELLKDNYRFDSNNNLILNADNYDIVKRIVLRILLNNLRKYNLKSEIKSKIESYVQSSSGSIDQILREVSSIFESARKDDKSVLSNDKEINQEDYENVQDTKKEEVEEFKAILDEIVESNDIVEDIPAQEIKQALDRIVVVDSTNKSDDLKNNISKATKDKSASIVVSTNDDILEVISEIVKTISNGTVLNNIVEYKAKKSNFKSETNKAFDNLRSSFKVSGLNSRNLNYFGDQFINEFERICNESGMSFEAMFADYFNSSSANRKYNSPMDRFIRQFMKYNGGDDSTRALLETMLVKKAISKNLISSKFNRYLKDGFKELSVTGGGYINFDRLNISNNRVNFGINMNVNSTSTVNGSMNVTDNIGMSIKGGADTGIVSEINTNLPGTNNINSIDGVDTNTTVEADIETSRNKKATNNENNGSNTDNKGKGAVQDNLAKPGMNIVRPNSLINSGNRFNMAKQAKNGVRGAYIPGGALMGAGTLGFTGKALGNAKRSDDVNMVGSSNHGHKNNLLNPNLFSDEDAYDDSDNTLMNDGDLDSALNVEDGTQSENKKDSKNNLVSDGVNNLKNQVKAEVKGALKKEAKKKAKKGILKFFGKSLFMRKYGKYIFIGAAALLGLLLLLLLIMGDDDFNSGDLDGACNYNDTTVTVTNCYDNDNERQVLAENISLDSYVKSALYAYTKGQEYSDDTLKAAMIAIKTSALSYGNYSSSLKHLELKSCSSFLKYCSLGDGCTISSLGTSKASDGASNNQAPAESSYSSKLDSIYNDISEYVFVSVSYDSAISSLSSVNALPFNEDTLNTFESLAKSGKDYAAILTETYSKKSETEENTTNNNENENKVNATNSNTIFVGDSRTYGLYQHVDQLTDDNTIGAGGQAFAWFNNSRSAKSNYTKYAKNGGINGVNELLKKNSNQSYNIVMWLGVNDFNYVAASKYVDKYVELLKGAWSKHKVYVLPVGPVNDTVIAKTYPHVTNAAINSYNSSLKSAVESAGLSNLIYLDIDWTSLNLNMNADGLHYYDKSDNENIYSTAMNAINNGKSISGELKLYKLTDYCVEMEVSGLDNDLFWWPVGSTKEETVGGVKFASGPPALTNISSPFGPRKKPCPTCSDMHAGIDIGAGGLANVYNVIASRDGVVVAVSYTGARGYYVKVDHGDGMATLYQHLHPNSTTVKVGAQVKQGQVLAKIGSSGVGTGPHLHFEVHINNTPVNPVEYVNKDNPRPMSAPGGNYSASAEFVKMLHNWEGTGKGATDEYYVVYADSGGVLTVGYGVTLKYNAPLFEKQGINVNSLRAGSKVDRKKVDSIENEIINNNINSVKSAVQNCGISLNEKQIYALVSRKYNTGNISGFCEKYKAYGNTQALYNNWMSKPVTDKRGNRLAGLVKRRQAEWNLFHNGVYPG